MKRPFRREISDNSAMLEELVRLYQGGVNVNGLSIHFGKDHSTIIYWLKKTGSHMISKPRRTSVFVMSYKKMHAERMSTTVTIGKYDYLFDEPTNPGKSYVQYLRERHPEEDVKRMMRNYAKR